MKRKNKMDYKSMQNEVESLRMKLQHVDTRSAQVDHLLAVIGTYKEKEVAGTVAIQLDSHAKKLSALQRTCLSQRDKVQSSLIKLAAANEELAAANEELAAANEKVAAANENLADVKEKLAGAKEKLKIIEMIQLGEQPDDIQDVIDDPPNPDQPIL